MVETKHMNNKVGQYGNYNIRNKFKPQKDFKHHYHTQIGPFIKLERKKFWKPLLLLSSWIVTVPFTSERVDDQGMQNKSVFVILRARHVARMGERRGVYTILVVKPEGRRPLGTHRRRWEDNIKMGFREVGCGAWTKSIWLRIGTGDGLLWMRYWTFGFHKMGDVSWLAENLLASQEGLCSVE